MIGPGYTMTDPLQGQYGYVWRAQPAGIAFVVYFIRYFFIDSLPGPNPDPAQYWNLAGVVHWNDWKPITGIHILSNRE